MRSASASVQSLVDDNAKFQTDNARLQVVVDVLRKSFRSYIKDNPKKKSRYTGVKKKTRCSFNGDENEDLSKYTNNKKRYSWSDLTAETYSLDSSIFTSTSDMDYQEDSMLTFDKASHSNRGSSSAQSTGGSSSRSFLSMTHECLVEKNSLHSIPEQDFDNKLGNLGY